MLKTIEEIITGWNWDLLLENLDKAGFVQTPTLLNPEECASLRELYADESRFRSQVNMGRYRYGEGEYKYFGYPLPPLVEELRTALYPQLVTLANSWMERMGLEMRYPADLTNYLEMCHTHAQTKSTPLILRYEAGGYNCLHQDLYGELAFPLQVVIGLDQREIDYTGGEFLLVEQRPRAQSYGQVVTIEQGQGLIFCNRYRPVAGTRGDYRVNVRHGVSKLISGTRHSLGIIFHDAA